MRKIYLLFIMVVSFFSCVKEDFFSYTPPPPPPQTVFVVEKSSNIPVQYAIVHLETCEYSDFLSCIGSTTFMTLTTDSLGKATYSTRKPVTDFSVEHPRYWQKRSESSYISLTPISVIKISLKRINTSSPNDILTILISDTLTNYGCCPLRYQFKWEQFGIQSAVYIKAFGNSNNRISWYFNNPTDSTIHTLPDLYINRFDTANILVEY